MLEKKLLPIPFTLRFKKRPLLNILLHFRYQPLWSPEPPKAEFATGRGLDSRLVKASTRWWWRTYIVCLCWECSGCLEILSGQPGFSLDSGDVQWQDSSQCLHRSHFLDHGIVILVIIFCSKTTRLWTITNNDHHSTPEPHLSDESILVTPSDTPLNKKTGFPTENIENPTQRGLYFRFMKNLKRLPKALFAEGCQSASFPMLGPHPTQTSARLLLSEIISQHYFRYLAGKRSEKSHFIGLLWQKSEIRLDHRRWWKSSLATSQMGDW